MMARWFVAGLCLSSIVLPVAAQQPGSARPGAESLVSFVARYEAALNANQLDGILAFWTEDGIFLPPDHAPVVGLGQIRGFYEREVFAVGRHEGYRLRLLESRVEGNLAYMRVAITGRFASVPGPGGVSIDRQAFFLLKSGPSENWTLWRYALHRNGPDR